MTVIHIGNGQLRGLAADTKPTIYPTGSTFLETDTGLIYYWNGTAWTPNVAVWSGFYVFIDTNDSNKIKARENLTGKIKYSHATDAGNVINSVIDDLVATTAAGGEIRLGAGTFNVTTTITLKNYIKIQGEGYSTILKLANTTNVDVIKTLNFATLTGTNSALGVHSFVLRDFVIDGNKANNTTACYGIRIFGYGYFINNIIVHDCKNDNIWSEWGLSLSAPSPHSMEAEWKTIKSYQAGARNLTFRGPHDTRFFDIVTYRAGTESVAVESGATYSGGSEMTGCHFWGNTDATKSTLLVNGSNLSCYSVIAEGSNGTGGKGIEVTSGATIRGSVNVFLNETGILLHSQNNDIQVTATQNTYGVVVDAAWNKITGWIQSNTTYGLNLSNYTTLNDITIDVHMRLNATHINWALATHNGIDLEAHVVTASGEIALSGNPNPATNQLNIYSSGAGTNFTVFPTSTPMLATKKYGAYVGLGTTQSSGILAGNVTAIAVGTGASGGISRVSGAGLAWRHTTGATINSIGGCRFNAQVFTQRDFNPWAQIRMRINQTATTRCFFGFTSSNAAPTSAADQLNALSGVMFGYDSGVDANWHIYQNDGTGASNSTTIANVAAANTSIHTFALRADNANSKFQYSYDGGTWADINTDIPAAATALGLIFQIENLTGSAMTMDVYYMEVIQDV